LSFVIGLSFAITQQRALFLEQSEKSYAENEYEDGLSWEYSRRLIEDERDLQTGTLNTSELSYGENEFEDGLSWEWQRNLA